jgi:hypothetical protein
MELLTAEIKLRPCTAHDLVHMQAGERITLSRQRFYVRTDDKLECYTLSQFSDKTTLKELAAQKRLWLPVQEDLDGNHTGRVISEPVQKAVAA